MRKQPFTVNQFYHIFNRGVDKRNIFLDDMDYFRFIHNLFELNDENPVLNVKYYLDSTASDIGIRSFNKRREPRERLVDILIFTLMPNHFHLILRQKREKGIIKFMQKLGTGYAMYFNKKYERTGVLFQGKFKAVLINKNEHFLYLPQYIHLNPISLKYGGSTSIDWRKKMKFLEEYRWSSLSDYIGRKNFPSVTQRNYFLETYGGEDGFKKYIEMWLKTKDHEDKLEAIKNVCLD